MRSTAATNSGRHHDRSDAHPTEPPREEAGAHEPSGREASVSDERESEGLRESEGRESA